MWNGQIVGYFLVLSDIESARTVILSNSPFYVSLLVVERVFHREIIVRAGGQYHNGSIPVDGFAFRYFKTIAIFEYKRNALGNVCRSRGLKSCIVEIVSTCYGLIGSYFDLGYFYIFCKSVAVVRHKGDV